MSSYLRTPIIHGYAHRTRSYGSALIWIGPFAFRIMTGAAARVQIDFKVWVNLRRTMMIRRDKEGRIVIWAWKDFPKA